MIIRGTPKNLIDYIRVDSEMSLKLETGGFIPKFIDSLGIYYIKSKEIENFIRKEDGISE